MRDVASCRGRKTDVETLFAYYTDKPKTGFGFFSEILFSVVMNGDSKKMGFPWKRV